MLQKTTKKYYMLFLVLLLIMLAACMGIGGNSQTPKATVTPTIPTQPDYSVLVHNVDLKDPLLPGKESIEVNITNTSDAYTHPADTDTTLKGGIIRPVYGDFGVFPQTSFKIQEVLPGKNLAVALPVNAQTSVNGQPWRMVFILLAPVLNPRTGIVNYVLAHGGIFEVSFYVSLSATPHTISASDYDAEKSEIASPNDEQYCVSAAQDINYPDKPITVVQSGATITKQWTVSRCRDTDKPIPPVMKGISLWCNFIYDGHGFDVRQKNTNSFGTNVTLPNQKGTWICAYMLAREITVKQQVYWGTYAVPLGYSLWFVVQTK